jgi:peptide/nickel transport system substrate-binding protein
MLDLQGNQLPYIDRCDLKCVEDLDALNQQIIGGKVNFLAHPLLQLKDLPLLRDHQESGGYRVVLWDKDPGHAPAWGINWNHPDDGKREMIRKVEFRRALSHAINRQQIKDVAFFGLGGPLSTGLASYGARQYYDRTVEGRAILEKLLNFAVEYDPDRAKDLLDRAGLVDLNGDGWRDLPDGSEFRFYIQIDGGSPYTESAEMIKDDWRAVGIDAIVEAMPGSRLNLIHRQATFDCRVLAGDAPGQAELLRSPVFMISHGRDGRWAPLYGAWMSLQGTTLEGVDADKPPREREPPWKAPLPDDPALRMWEIYQKAMLEPDDHERNRLVHDLFQIHLNEGPFWLGIVAYLPRPVIIGRNLQNIPRDDEVFDNLFPPWGLGQPGAITYPELYSFAVVSPDPPW